MEDVPHVPPRHLSLSLRESLNECSSIDVLIDCGNESESEQENNSFVYIRTMNCVSLHDSRPLMFSLLVISVTLFIEIWHHSFFRFEPSFRFYNENIVEMVSTDPRRP